MCLTDITRLSTVAPLFFPITQARPRWSVLSFSLSFFFSPRPIFSFLPETKTQSDPRKTRAPPPCVSNASRVVRFPFLVVSSNCYFATARHQPRVCFYFPRLLRYGGILGIVRTTAFARANAKKSDRQREVCGA